MHVCLYNTWWISTRIGDYANVGWMLNGERLWLLFVRAPIVWDENNWKKISCKPYRLISRENLWDIKTRECLIYFWKGERERDGKIGKQKCKFRVTSLQPPPSPVAQQVWKIECRNKKISLSVVSSFALIPLFFFFFSYEKLFEKSFRITERKRDQSQGKIGGEIVIELFKQICKILALL